MSATTSNILENVVITSKGFQKQAMYLWADTVELVCLQNSDFYTPIDEALDEQLGDGAGIGGEDFLDGAEEMHPDDFTDGVIDNAPAQKNDRKSIILEDVGRHLEARCQLFGEYYPFILEENAIQRKETLTKSHRMYIFLLLASRSSLLGIKDAIRKDFEILSCFCLKWLVPGWTTKLFGTAPCSAIDCFTGSPHEKIKSLAQELGISHVLGEQDIERYSHSNGDAGIDAVAWHAINDCSSDNMPVILAQAGCTAIESEMFKKIPSHSKWQGIFPKISIQPCMMTPQSYRNNRGEWMQPSEINHIFIDRNRILQLFGQNNNFDFDLLQTLPQISGLFEERAE